MAAEGGHDQEQRRQQIFTVHCTTSSSRVKASWSSSFCVTEAGVEFLSEENKCAARQ